MKLFIVLAAVTLAQAAKLDRTYLPPNAQASAGSSFLETPRESNGFQDQTRAYSTNEFSSTNGFLQTGAYSGFESRPERAQAAFERNAAILRQDNSNDGETYAYAYETENGIYGEENGVATNGVQAQGGYSYTGDDGKVYSVRYTADENGFQPQGDHLPTPPPVPEEIMKALEQNARDEAAGIYDDGSYNEVKYFGSSQEQDTNNALLRNDATQSGSSVSGVQKAYLPPFAQRNKYNNAQANNYNNALPRNDAAQSGSSVAGVQKAYLPPFAQRNNYNNALPRNDAAQSGSSVAGVQKAYLPPFAQRNNYNNALPRNDAAQSGSSVAGVQKAYLPPFAQRNNYNNAQPNIKDATSSGSSVAGVQKAYLPPFAQRNNYNNALPRNDVAQSGSSVAGVQKAYLSPFAQRNNYNNALLRKDAAQSGSSVAGVQKAYLPPFAQRNNAQVNYNDAASSGSSVAGVQKAYLPPFAQRNNQKSGARQPSFNARDGYRY